ncbi:hypothetical protein GI482_00345 [Bacillus sp. N3536]|nr:hypothetical protein GI482_00345 [Bacillus sp. N3536]
MAKGLLRFLIVATLLISAIGIQGQSASAKANKVMWGKTELKIGQIGKVTILSPSELVKLNSDGSLSTVRALKKSEEFRVYSFKSQHGGLYGVGGGSYVKKNSKAKYETPSKSKLALLHSNSNENVKVDDKMLKILKDKKEYSGDGKDLIAFKVSVDVIEISFVNNKGNPYMNRWLFHKGKLVDQLWKNGEFNKEYTSNSLLGGIVKLIMNPGSSSEEGKMELYGQDGEYLGILTTNKFQSDSVFNEFGSYGSKFSSTSIWNKFGTYGSEFSTYSAFNKFSQQPPTVVIQGEVIGYITVNPYISNSIHPNDLYEKLKEAGF